MYVGGLLCGLSAVKIIVVGIFCSHLFFVVSARNGQLFGAGTGGEDSKRVNSPHLGAAAKIYCLSDANGGICLIPPAFYVELIFGNPAHVQ